MNRASGTPVHRVVVGISGASGAVLGVRLLQALRQVPSVESHLVVSDAGLLTLRHEMNMEEAQVAALAAHYHPCRNVGATIASGAFACHGMVVAPCSMRTLAAVAHGLADNLLTRAADVTLKERRKLILLVRVTPLNLAHLRNMVAVTEMGGIIFPPVPAYYHQPQSMEEATGLTVTRVLDLLDVPHAAISWQGLPGNGGAL